MTDPHCPPSKVLFIDASPSLLREIVTQTAEQLGGYTVHVIDAPHDVVSETTALDGSSTPSPDAMLVELDDDEVPRRFQLLRERWPDCTIVGVMNDGAQALFCVPDIGIDQLLRTLRAAMGT